MLKSRLLLSASLLVPALYLAPVLQADDTVATTGGIAPRPLIDLSTAGSESKFTPDEPASNGQVAVSRSDSPAGALVTIAPGDASYPAVSLKPDGGAPWDLSPFGHVEVTITNTGTAILPIALRVDGTNWKDNNAALARIKPGETQTVKVVFGYSYGNPANMIKTSAISQVLIIGGKTATNPETFRIEAVQAAGVAGEKLAANPTTIRIMPKDGILLGAGGTPLDPAKNLVSKGAQGALVDASGAQNLKIDFPAGTSKLQAGIKPEAGKWALIDSLEVRAKVRNDGQSPITPTLQVDSNGGTVSATADAPLAPGAETELVASYINPKIWTSINATITKAYGNNPDPGTGNAFASNQVTEVLIGATPDSTARTLTVESIKADLPPYSAPDWLGTKPPVDGEWTKTLDEEFDGPTLDMTKWNNTNPDNYWDQRTHWSKDNLVLGGGVIKLHYEKKTGPMNDEEGQKQTDYTCGYLDSYGKWTQRYGYFEARMKLPKAPGLWPAFWLMPDRGVADGVQWKRASTGVEAATNTQGMEFDIVEFLSGWGPCRYNIAMHWDGYGKEHKSTGSTMNYVQPDKDGFITAGLLWLPGQASYYCNGKEILHFENARVSNTQSSFIFDVVSGGWENLPLDNAKLPDDFVIDYVRVWQRKDLATPEDGIKTAASAPAPAPATPPTK